MRTMENVIKCGQPRGGRQVDSRPSVSLAETEESGNSLPVHFVCRPATVRRDGLQPTRDDLRDRQNRLNPAVYGISAPFRKGFS